MRDWARRVRWTLAVGGAVVLGVAGVSIFGQPAHEVLYSADPPRVVCHARGCTAIYRLEVGNSGSEPQDGVVVRLRRAVVERALLAVWVRDYGKFDRATPVRDEGDVRVYPLGRLEPGVRVEISFVLAVPRADAAAPWGDVLVGVEAPRARVAAGQAAWVTVLRAWYAFLAIF